jgi:hypothetical protein
MPDPNFIFTDDRGNRYGITSPPGATLDHAQQKLKQLQQRFPNLTGKVEKAPLTGALAPTEDPGFLAGVKAGVMPYVLGAAQTAGDETMRAQALKDIEAQQAEYTRGIGHFSFDLGEEGARAVPTIAPHILGAMTGGAFEAAGLWPIASQAIGHGIGGVLSGAIKPVSKGNVAEEKRYNATVDGIIDGLTGGAAKVAEKVLAPVEEAVKGTAGKILRSVLPPKADIIPLQPTLRSAARSIATPAVASGAGVEATSGAEEAEHQAAEGSGGVVGPVYQKAKSVLLDRAIKGGIGHEVEAIAGDEGKAPTFDAAEGEQARAILSNLTPQTLAVIGRMSPEDQRQLLRNGVPDLLSAAARSRPQKMPAAPPLRPAPVPKRPVPQVTPLDDPLSHSTPGLGLGLMPQDAGDPFYDAAAYMGNFGP